MGFDFVLDDTLPKDTAYLMPGDIVDLIAQAKRGEIDWDYVIDEVTEAAKDGRISILTNIG